MRLNKRLKSAASEQNLTKCALSSLSQQKPKLQFVYNDVMFLRMDFDNFKLYDSVLLTFKANVRADKCYSCFLLGGVLRTLRVYVRKCIHVVVRVFMTHKINL